MSESAPVCGFCKGGPVGDAATWLDGIPRGPAPCPRCGETYGALVGGNNTPQEGARKSPGAGGQQPLISTKEES